MRVSVACVFCNFPRCHLCVFLVTLVLYGLFRIFCYRDGYALMVNCVKVHCLRCMFLYAYMSMFYVCVYERFFVYTRIHMYT